MTKEQLIKAKKIEAKIKDIESALSWMPGEIMENFPLITRTLKEKVIELFKEDLESTKQELEREFVNL